jgi:hypothetical protein
MREQVNQSVTGVSFGLGMEDRVDYLVTFPQRKGLFEEDFAGFDQFSVVQAPVCR